MGQIEILFGFNETSAFMSAIFSTQDRFDFWFFFFMFLIGIGDLQNTFW